MLSNINISMHKFVMLGLYVCLCVRWQVQAFRRLTVCMCMWVHLLCACSSLSCSDVLKSDIFQVVLSTEVPVLSECQYDSSSHTHRLPCTLFASFLSDTYAHTQKTQTCTHTQPRMHSHNKTKQNNKWDIVPFFCWPVIWYCSAPPVQHYPPSLH